MIVGAALGLGAVCAWVITVPVHRFKERRPLTPRDIDDEADTDIRAVLRHARCPDCCRDHEVADVVPVWSWWRGCPSCGRRMPATVVSLQLVLPVAAAVTAVVFDSPGDLVPYLWFLVVLAAVAVIDARILLIPWWLPWVGTSVGLALMVPVAIARHDPAAVGGAVLGAAGAFGLFWILWVLAPAGLGFGDVRLAAMVGLFLGWWSPSLVVWGLLLGSLAGVVAGTWSLVRGRGRHFAFGPALGTGAVVALWTAPLLAG